MQRHTNSYRAVVSGIAFVLMVIVTMALAVVVGSAAQAVTRPTGPLSTKSSARHRMTRVKTVHQAKQLFADDGGDGYVFGWSVAISGSTAVVGAPYTITGTDGMETGAAYVFTKSGSTWSLSAELTAPDGATGDDFGASVAVSGSTIAVGAPEHDNGIGGAYIFTRTGSTWSMQSELVCPDTGGGDKFGYSVVTSGTAVVVGADEDESDGAAYVYTEPAGGWLPLSAPQHELVPSDAQGSDRFGWSMTLSGTTLAVSAVRHDANGAVYVYNDDSWAEPSPSAYLVSGYSAELVASNGAANDYFGDKIALSGSQILVGAPGHASQRGAAYLFADTDGTWSTWTQKAELKAKDGAPMNCFGWAVGLSGRTALVGAELHDDATGAAYVFKSTGGTWSERSELTALGGEKGDEFGYSASLSGSTALIGADQYDPSTGTSDPYYGTGTAYLFTI